MRTEQTTGRVTASSVLRVLIAVMLVTAWASSCTGELNVREEGSPGQEEDVGAGDVDDSDVDEFDVDDAATDVDETDTDAGDDTDVPEGMELVPAGTYRRGCDPALDDECRDQETPAHEVEVSAFAIDRYPVTESEYGDCMFDGDCSEPPYDGHGDDYPVVEVRSEDAKAYCEWADKRLPTEAEWEKAARGTDERIYPWGDDEPDCSLANYDECGEEIEPIGQYPDATSPYGVEEMVGNVRHWTADWYDPDYYEESPTEDPQGPDAGETRAVRGGSYFWGETALRASSRNPMDGGADSHGPDVGFRCATSVE